MQNIISKKKLQWMLLIRVILVTTLLGSAITVQIVYYDAPPYRVLYLLIGLTYIFTIFYAIFYKLLHSRLWYVYLQLIIDTLSISMLIYFTGGVESRFTMLLTIPIITASIILDRKGSTIIVAMAFIAYGLMVNLLYYNIIPNPSGVDLSKIPIKNFFYDLFYNLALFLITAILVGYLAETLRRTGKRLEKTSIKLDDMKVFNRNVVDSMNAGLTTTDLAGNVISYNKLARKISKKIGTPLESESITKLLGVNEKKFKKIREEILLKNQFSYEKTYSVKKNEKVILTFNIVSLPNSKKEIIGYIFSFQDITDIRKMEAELKMKDKMAALGSMASSIAHEIRNPLAAISGSAQELSSSGNFHSTEKAMLDIIVKETRRLNKTIENYLQFAKPLKFRPVPFDLNKTIRDTVILAQKSPDFKKGLHKIGFKKPLKIENFVGDADSLKQVFWNLILNALQAMPKGGNLDIIITRSRNKNEIKISFSDEGKGFPQKTRNELFEPFSSSKDGGVGLGLSVVYRIIQEHGGKITIKKRRPQGTKVELYIPNLGPSMEIKEL